MVMGGASDGQGGREDGKLDVTTSRANLFSSPEFCPPFELGEGRSSDDDIIVDDVIVVEYTVVVLPTARVLTAVDEATIH